MKALSVIIWMLAASTLAQSRLIYRQPPPPPTPEEVTRQALRLNAMSFVPVDPWRQIGNQNYYAKGPEWVQFVGQVQQVHSDGIRVRGYYGPPSLWPTNKISETMHLNDLPANKPVLLVPVIFEFFVSNFPHQVAEDQLITWEMKYVSRTGKPHTYNTAAGSTRTLRGLEYGKISEPPAARPLTISEIRSMEAKRAKTKADQQAATLRHYERLAGQDDAYGQFRLGEIYLKGIGIEADTDKGLQLLRKAKAAGNADAARLIEQFSN